MQELKLYFILTVPYKKLVIFARVNFSSLLFQFLLIYIEQLDFIKIIFTIEFFGNLKIKKKRF